MSVSAHPRLPLVLSATARALDDAARLLPGVVLENVVEAAIRRGDIHGEPGIGRPTKVFVAEHGVVVVIQRVRARPSGRRAWVPVGVEPWSPTRREP